MSLLLLFTDTVSVCWRLSLAGEFLFQQVREGVVVAVLFKNRTGDAAGVILRPQVVHFS